MSCGLLATLAALNGADAYPNYMTQGPNGEDNCHRALDVGASIMGSPAVASPVRKMVILDANNNQLNVGERANNTWTYIPDHEYTIEINDDSVSALSNSAYLII